MAEDLDDGGLIDISPPVGPASPVWPGDTAYESHVHWPRTDASAVEVRRFTTTGHVGAHADAPAHFLAGGATTDELPLAPFLGPCQVVHCLTRADRALVGLDEVRAAIDHGVVAPRLLLRTYQEFPTTWVDEFPGVAVEVIDWFAAQGGRLIGVDTASLDPMRSTAMAAHRAAAAHGVAILENLLLDQVPEGHYELIALPLRLTGMDASPVRAVLRRLS